MSEDATDQIEKRKFTRINTDVDSGKGGAIRGAQMLWKTFPGKVSKVFDVSYQGAAVERLADTELQVGEQFDVDFEFDGFSVVTVQVEVRWVGEKVIGLYFTALFPESRLQFDQFISDKLIGAHLVLVDKEYYSEDLDCDKWYQGPSDTNIYIWRPTGGVTLKVDFTEGTLKYEGGQLAWSLSEPSPEAQDLYGDGGSIEGLVGTQQSKEKAFKAKALSVISQLLDREKDLAPMIEQLKKK